MCFSFRHNRQQTNCQHKQLNLITSSLAFQPDISCREWTFSETHFDGYLRTTFNTEVTGL